MKICLWSGLLLLIGSLSAYAQLSEDFSDGDFTNNPAWYGNTNRFQVSDGELQLFDTDPGASNLSFLGVSAPTSLDQFTSWEFLIRMEFAPSSNNHARIYLAALDSDLGSEQQGYYLKVGGVSGTEDALELYRQDGDDDVLLISATTGAVAEDPALARVRVNRSTAGVWELWADYTGGTNFQLEGTAMDATYDLLEFFGLVCIYTSTRAERFFLDDVLIDPLYTDETPPELLSVNPLSSTLLHLIFDEPLDESSVADVQKYELTELGNPAEAMLDTADVARIELRFGSPMSNQEVYILSVSGIRDLNGNESGLQTASFEFFQLEDPQAYDVLINEIMADPNPPILLPETEYLELYNRSDRVFDLAGWTLSDGGTPAELPAHILLPDSLLILCEPEDVDQLTVYGPVLAVPGLPGLNNSGDNLVLRDASGALIHQVVYTDEWYRESDKDDGGWSLELINPLAPCLLGSNWIASESLQGGTPGSRNSVLEQQPDGNGLSLLRVFPLSPQELLLTFDKAVSQEKASLLSSYALDNNVTIADAMVSASAPNEVSLWVAPPLQAGLLYTLTITDTLTDCVGMGLTEARSYSFGLPAPYEAGDLIIHELLFNPEVGGVDFVELYNPSGKILDLQDLVIGNIQGNSDSIAAVTAARLVLPDELIVLTERPGDILARYTVPQPQNLVENELPVFPDREGNVTLFTVDHTGNAIILDEFDYSSELHNPLLDDENGVSLERIDPSAPSQDASTWQSAAAAAGYATPTGPNSQLRAEENPSEDLFQLPYKTFSPDGDGYFDFLTIDYNLDKSGYSASIRIFDAVGRLVKDLMLNELLPSEGTIVWEGDNFDNQKARIGIYVVWVELFHPDGEVQIIKKSCVLAGRL